MILTLRSAMPVTSSLKPDPSVEDVSQFELLPEEPQGRKG